MKILPIILVVALLAPNTSTAQTGTNSDSLVVTFWTAVHKSAAAAQECLADVLSNRRATKLGCNDARPALEQSFLALAHLEVCCRSATRYKMADQEGSMRDLMLAPAGMVYLIAETEHLRTTRDRERMMAIAATLVARQIQAEFVLEQSGAAVPKWE